MLDANKFKDYLIAISGVDYHQVSIINLTSERPLNL